MALGKKKKSIMRGFFLWQSDTTKPCSKSSPILMPSLNVIKSPSLSHCHMIGWSDSLCYRAVEQVYFWTTEIYGYFFTTTSRAFWFHCIAERQTYPQLRATHTKTIRNDFKKIKKKALQVREKCVTLIFAKSLSKHHVHVHSIAVFLNSIPLQPSKMTGYYH